MGATNIINFAECEGHNRRRSEPADFIPAAIANRVYCRSIKAGGDSGEQPGVHQRGCDVADDLATTAGPRDSGNGSLGIAAEPVIELVERTL